MTGGLGGTQAAGGDGGLGYSVSPGLPVNGNPGTSGAGGGGWHGAGWGGDGYYGGGAGGASGINMFHTGAGGGGGSSFVLQDGSLLASVLPGAREVPGNPDDTDRGPADGVTGQKAGDGGFYVENTNGGLRDRGKPGRVFILFRPPESPSSPPFPPLPTPPIGTPSSVELTHGYRNQTALAPPTAGATTAEHLYPMRQDAYASYEIVVDSTSGDIGNPSTSPPLPLRLERVRYQGTVLQTSLATGTGPGRTLRWQNTTGVPVTDQVIRVASSVCSTNCGSDDVYRIRAYDTTYTLARFNNTGSQLTVILVENPTASSVSGALHFWGPTGAWRYTQAFSVAAKGTLVFNTATVLPSESGSVTIANNAPYGRLSGKAVALEADTGYSFDTPMQPRPR